MSEHILLRHRDIPGIDRLETYLSNGGFEAFKKVVTTMQPDEVVNEVKSSGLRGRGGASFPTGVKWGFLPSDLWPHYLVANADESEPGTFKDREILESNPFQFLEGLMIASYGIQANVSYIYLRGEFSQIGSQLDQCITRLVKAGFLGEKLFGTSYGLNLFTHLGAGAYICGEETALLESIEGNLAQPRNRPPYPVVTGLYGKPTVVNNVETLTNLPPILANGAAWHRALGTLKCPGVKIFCLSGCVNKPGNYELPLGTTFRELIYEYGGGITGGKKIKAIMPAGASSNLIVADDHALDCPMDYETVRSQLGTPLGSASVIVINEDVNVAWLAKKTTEFFIHESCGKCTPCRIGTRIINDTLGKIVHGEGELADLDTLQRASDTMVRTSLCGLGQAASNSVSSSLHLFTSEYEAQLTGSRSTSSYADPAILNEAK